MKQLEQISEAFSGFVWGTPLVLLLLGGGFFFLIYSKFLVFRYFRHSINIIRGKYDDPDEPGQINHFEALSTALSATVGMGNVSGVAIAIATGGPGAIFWMWVSAFFGITTKFFTCTLAVLFRGRDSNGNIQGGPMYFITEGLGKKWRPLAVFFAMAGMIGVLPMFQVNQYTQAVRDIVLADFGIEGSFITNLLTGLVLTFFVSLVIFGGIKRIGKVASKLVPFMSLLYIIAVLVILGTNIDGLIPGLKLIVNDAFTGKAILGGALGQLIITGIKRGTFSNEAGLGTAPMAHGAAKTKEPVREGLVAMIEPIIDTIFICTMTALAIIVTGVWDNPDIDGITLTAEAFSAGIPFIGKYVLILAITFFAMSSLFAFPYYGTKSFGFLFGAKKQYLYNYFYIFSIILGATASLKVIINIIDGVYGLMAIPTMIAALLLAPKVKAAYKDYFARHKGS